MGDAGATRHTISRLRVHLAQKLESSAGQSPARRERCPHNQCPMPLATISGRSQVWQPGSQWGAAHAHSPPQVPGSTATLRDLQSVTRSKKIKGNVL